MSPEVIDEYEAGRVSSKRGVDGWHGIDMYAFAIMMWEVMTLRQPWMRYMADKKTMRGIKAMWDSVRRGGRPRATTLECLEAPPGYMSLIEQMWQHDPTQRPTFEVAIGELKSMQEWCVKKGGSYA